MRHGISELMAICTLALGSLLSGNANAAPSTIHQESFEGCTGTGYSLLSGTFGALADDGIECGPAFTTSSQSGTVTGFDGSNYIALEDIDGAGFTNPNAVVLAPINISNATSLGISFLFAAPNATNPRYEPEDILQVQYSVDAGPFITVGSFRGTGAVGMAEDDNLDGTFTVPVTGLAMQRFSYSLDNRAGQGIVSGTSLVVRILFSSEGSHEEMMFDDIIVSGSVSVPVIDFAASAYSYNEDGTPVASEVTLTRSGGTAGTASIDVTFSAGTAVAPGDFTATTIGVSFAAGETTQTVALPIVDDAIDEDDETFTLGLLADGSGAIVGTTTTSATITLVDDDVANVSVSESAVSVSEAGTTDTFTVVLESEPTADVEVDISAASGQALLDSGGVPAASLLLTFTSADWDTPQTVTVSAVDDVVVEANPHAETLSFTVTSSDGKYDGFALADVSVSVAENDGCGDTICNPSESTATCPDDCGSLCGDAACNGAETTATCPADCGSDCGDGTANGPEACDGADLLGATCVSQGFDYGILLCALNCTFDTAACDYALGADAGPDGGLIEAGVSDTATGDSTYVTDVSATGDDVSATGDTVTFETSSEVPAASTGEVSSAPATVGGATSAGGVTTEPTSTPPVDVTSAPVEPTSAPPVDVTSGAAVSVPGQTSAPIATLDVTSADSPSEGSTSEPATTVVAETSSSTPSVPTTEVIPPGETGNDNYTSEPPDQTSEDGVGPGIIVDAGPDAGGFIGGNNDDGCDCRVGARPRSNLASLIALSLVGMVFVRMRRRRQS